MKFFRNFFKSKIGLGITMAFLVLIALAFTSSDVSNTSVFGGVAGGDRVAVVGDTDISTADLTRNANNGLERVREQNPTLSMAAFVGGGGLEQVLEQLVSRAAVGGFARDLGLRAGNNLINSEIQRIPAFRGPDGQFSEAVYQQAIAAQSLTDRLVRDDLSAGLLARQTLLPVTVGSSIPDAIARRYAALFKERRQGAIAFLPGAAFAPNAAPSDAQLQSFYQANRAQFIRPERRVLRYAVFGEDAVMARIEPTDAAIAAYYRDNQAQFAANETRTFTQVIAGSQAQAQAIRQAAAGGQSLAAAAQRNGLRTSELPSTSRDQIATQASRGVADAYFAAAQGSLTTPARSPLGWHVAQVTAVQRSAGRSLDQARAEIVAVLRERNRTRALSTLSEEVEAALADGSSITQVAQDLGLQVRTTPPVTADGRVYGQPDQQLEPQIQPAVATAFQMEESAPQLAEVERGKTFIIFDVARVTESAAAPLAEIRADVGAAWRLSAGLAAARRAADALVAQARGGRSMSEALRAAGIANAQVEPINLTREQLASAGAQRVPPPLALLFSMAQGTAKKLEAEQGLGWYVVDLQSIEAGRIADNDLLLTQARSSLSPVVAEEYAQQFERAMRDAVGYERNAEAFAAVRRQLSGDN
jgi:peptidyl-prolyl cis-trans isomerase D